jgi:xanthine dehydrogenase large subunit
MSGASLKGHESARGHVSGRAVYTDEQRAPTSVLSAVPVQAPHAHARILGIDASAALAMPGVVAVVTAADIPGENDTGPIVHDEPLMPSDKVQFHGQAVAWVVACDEATAWAGAAEVAVRYEPLPACTDIAGAIATQAYHRPPAQVSRGDADAQLQKSTHRIQGEIRIGGQDHFYLETQASWAEIDSEGMVQVSASTQHPSETQIIVARVLGLPANRVVCRSLRMGGGFGGKETQANPYAAIAALAAWRTRRAVRVKLNRSADMQMTGKRHPFFARYEVGFDERGMLQAMKVQLVADGGWSTDLSPPVLMRAMVHIDNAYFCPHVSIEGLIAKTNLPSNTAFRGFGGPQGMLVGEEIMDRIARHLRLPPHQVRERNFYAGDGSSERNTTPYGQVLCDLPMRELWQELKASSDFDGRMLAIETFNATHAQRKRGLAITPVKFGISFNKVEYNQAGALVHIYTDGSVQLNHGGTEMGQGLHSKMLAVASRCLGIDVARIQIMVTSTDKVPNTSATAASSGSDLNGQAVKAACETLLARMRPVAATLLQCEADDVVFAEDAVFKSRRTVAAPAIRRGGAGELPRTHQPLRHGLLSHAGLVLGSCKRQGQSVLLLCLRCGRQRGGSLRLHRHASPAAGGHTPRRRRFADREHRPWPDRGRLRAGHGLVDLRGTALERCRQTADRCAEHVQDSHRRRSARGVSGGPASATEIAGSAGDLRQQGGG